MGTKKEASVKEPEKFWGIRVSACHVKILWYRKYHGSQARMHFKKAMRHLWWYITCPYKYYVEKDYR